ncbi:MAG: ribosome assembly factor SBDS [Candidatus Diapherotrites archaeon]|nr:ribosome assembly factor SBDS [Candidatus Diapherotrites archaeon]
MIPVDKAVIARLDSHGHHFEILVDPERAWEVRENPEASLDEVVASDHIYKDANKGEKASEEALMEAFQTTDFNTIAKTILKKGEIQITTEQRHEMQKERKRQIINIIVREAIDPRTNTPHTPARIEKAMEEAKVHIDPFKSAQRQVEDIINKLRPILPIKFAKARIKVVVPAQYAGKVYSYLHGIKRISEEWKNDGSLEAVIEVPAGMQSELYDTLNKMTHGMVETELIETV